MTDNKHPTEFTPEEIEALCRECGGRCCFCIPYTHSMIDIKAFVEAGDLTPLVDSKEEHDHRLKEFRFIAENWEQISILEAKRTATYNIPGWSTEDGASHYFRCGVWDPKTLRCLKYDQRPANCRGFPFFDSTSAFESQDYLNCLLVAEAKRRQRNRRRCQLRRLDEQLKEARRMSMEERDRRAVEVQDGTSGTGSTSPKREP